MRFLDLGTLSYRQAWALQEQAHAEVVAGGEERVFFVEHPPVITFGRRSGLERDVLASDEQLAKVGVEVVHSDRGGQVTFHGPGQLVVYPIIRLADHKLLVGSYVRGLLELVVTTLANLGVTAEKMTGETLGIWVMDQGRLAKICALGVRVKQGVSLHGIALNVSTDLSFFNWIVPCGMPGASVTSLNKLLGRQAPKMDSVKSVFQMELGRSFGTTGQVLDCDDR